MKKIIGVIVYCCAFLGPAYIITETDIDIGDSFVGVLCLFIWIMICMSIGTVLMKSGNNNE